MRRWDQQIKGLARYPKVYVFGCLICPHVSHPKAAQRMAGIDLGGFRSFERPLSGNPAAAPRRSSLFDRRIASNFTASALVGSVRVADSQN